jgi:hypothetical protein
MPNTRGIAVGLLFGGLTLALLFAGQALSFAAWWLGRAITGGVTILFAFGVGYAVYELYSGWTATTEPESSSAEWDAGPETNENKKGSEDIDEGISDQELEEELEKLKNNTETMETETAK